MIATLARRTPFFYGWVIIIVSSLASSFTTGVLFWGLGLFVPFLETELEWSRSVIFLPLAMGAVVSAILGPLFGHLFDKKHGPRILFFLGALAFAASLAYMRWVASPWTYLLIFGVVGGIGRWAIQVNAAVVPKWFIRRRGVAQAAAMGGAAGGPLLFPLLIQALISSVGWRDAWLVLGLALGVLALLGPALIVRAPEDVGLAPDGGPARTTPRHAGPPRPPVADRSFTRRQALRTGLFWLLVVTISAGTLGIRGMMPNFAPYFLSVNLPGSIVAWSFTVHAAVVIPAGFLWGYLADRHGARTPFALVCAVAGSALLALAFVPNTVMLLVLMAYLGLGLGGFWTLGQVVVANTFGRHHIGAIRGAMTPFQNGAMFGAPLLFGLLFDATGSYTVLFTIAVSAWSVSLITVFFLQRFRLPQPTPAATSEAART